MMCISHPDHSSVQISHVQMLGSRMWLVTAILDSTGVGYKAKQAN